MSQKKRKGFIWLVRGAEERTLNNCIALIREMAGDEPVHVINERPFTAALKRAYEIAEASTAEWMISIDGDVLLERNGLFKLREVAKSTFDDTVVVQGLTLDKFIPIIRTAGTSMFRCKYAQRASVAVPVGKNPLRPESAVIETLLSQGLQFYRTNIIVGAHDFEQYYSTIYRKMYLHARKHKNVMTETEAFWQENKSDGDYKLALAAVAASTAHKSDVPVDKLFKQKEAADVLFLLDMEEKIAMPPNTYTLSDVAALINKFETVPEIQQKKFPQYETCYYLKPPKTPKKKLSVLNIIGNKIVQTGKQLKRRAFLMD